MENSTTKPTTHFLKTIQPFFNQVKARTKRFEIRRNDRNFKVGDYLILQEWEQKGKHFTGKQLIVKVELLFDTELKFCLKQDFCCMAIKFKEEFTENELLDIEIITNEMF